MYFARDWLHPSRFPCCVLHHICLWYLSLNAAGECRYKIMKTNFSWVGQSINSILSLDLVPWLYAMGPWKRKLIQNYILTHLVLQLQTNSFICTVCHKSLCSHVCGLHISMVHSILEHCVRMCPWMGSNGAWKDPRQQPAVQPTPTGHLTQETFS